MIGQESASSELRFDVSDKAPFPLFELELAIGAFATRR